MKYDEVEVTLLLLLFNFKVKGDESFDSALEDEAAIEVEHLLAEPKSDHVSVDNVFCFDEENLEECLKVEDNSCIYESALKTNSGNVIIILFFRIPYAIISFSRSFLILTFFF